MIIGDSISVGYGLQKNEHSFVDMLSELAGFHILLKAGCGDDIFSVISKLDKLNNHSNQCVIFIGTNGILKERQLIQLVRHIKRLTDRIILCNLLVDSSKNNIIKNVSIKENTLFCDLNLCFKGNSNLLRKDKIHPNNEGHYIIYRELLKLLNAK